MFKPLDCHPTGLELLIGACRFDWVVSFHIKPLYLFMCQPFRSSDHFVTARTLFFRKATIFQNRKADLRHVSTQNLDDLEPYDVRTQKLRSLAAAITGCCLYRWHVLSMRMHVGPFKKYIRLCRAI